METRKISILVVDDDDRARRLLEAMLLPNGYSVHLAADGSEAAAIAASQKPDLILLDIMMPKQDGYSTLAQLKANASTKGIPVVMVSAVGYPLNRTLASQFGASAYITKPVELKQLLGTISGLLQPA